MKGIPKVVQLPGGVRLEGVAFRVVEYNDDGTPRLFELLPKGEPAVGKGIWILYAHEDSIRARVAETDRSDR